MRPRLPLAVPVLCIIERRTGWVFLPVLLLVAKGMEYRGFTKYLIIALMAIVIRRYDIIEKIERRLEGRTALRVLIMAADIALLAVNCYMINTLCEDDTWLTLVYLASTFLVVLMYVLVIKGITPLKAFLIKTGKHSMNVFLTHTFIYYYFFADFIYSFRYVPAIWLALFTTSMALAVILDYTGGRLTKAAGDMLERTVKRETRCA